MHLKSEFNHQINTMSVPWEIEFLLNSSVEVFKTHFKGKNLYISIPRHYFPLSIIRYFTLSKFPRHLNWQIYFTRLKGKNIGGFLKNILIDSA